MHLYDIESLAVERGFDQLSEPEQSFVLEVLGSREEYDRLHTMLLVARQAMDIESGNLAPSEGLASQLRARIEIRQATGTIGQSWRKAGRARGVLGYRAPLWQGGLALLGVVVIALIANPRSQIVIPPPVAQIVYVPQIVVAAQPTVELDTDAIVRRVVDSLKEEIRSNASSDGRRGAYTALPSQQRRRSQKDTTGEAKVRSPQREQQEDHSIETNRRNSFVGLANLAQAERQRSGKSINEDSLIARFLVPAGRRN